MPPLLRCLEEASGVGGFGLGTLSRGVAVRREQNLSNSTDKASMEAEIAMEVLAPPSSTGSFGPLAYFIALLLVAYISFQALKLYLLPIIIQQVVEYAPLDIEPIIYKFNLHQLTETGLHFSLKASIPQSKIPLLHFFWVPIA
jgi:hypothetical protein